MGKIISNGIEYGGMTNINGVFIDTNNVIISLTEYKPSMTYTATEDCYVVLYTVFGSNTTIYINSEIVGNFDGSGNLGITNNFYLKKGQTISVANASSSYNSYYIVYGVQQGSTSQGSSGGIDYSTTEQKTGQKWINGKDIYQTTVHLESGDFTIGGRTDGISNGLSNVETIITKEAIGIHSNGSGTAYFSNYFATSDDYVCQIFDIGATAFSIYVGRGFSTMTDIYVTFQYTKSTI